MLILYNYYTKKMRKKIYTIKYSLLNGNTII